MANAQEIQSHAAPSSPAPRTGFLGLLERIDHGLSRLEGWLLTGILFLLIFVGAFQALKRNFFPPSPDWVEPILRWSVFAIGLLSAAMASQAGRLISIDLVTRALSPAGRLIVRLVTTVFTIFVCAFLLVVALEVREALMTEQGFLIDPSTGWLAFPIAMGLICFHLGVRVVLDIAHVKQRTVPAELVEGAPSL